MNREEDQADEAKKQKSGPPIIRGNIPNQNRSDSNAPWFTTLNRRLREEIHDEHENENDKD